MSLESQGIIWSTIPNHQVSFLHVIPDTPEPKSAQNPKISGYRVYETLPAPPSLNSGRGIPVCSSRVCRQKSIVSPSSEGVGWATGAQVHHLHAPGPSCATNTDAEEVFNPLNPKSQKICIQFRFEGPSRPTQHLRSIGKFRKF